METILENNYKPSEPAKRLHASQARVIVCVGGLGSGKSFSVVKEIEQSAIQWPGMPIAVYRKTMPALRDSTLTEFKKHSDNQIGSYKYREDTWTYINGSYVVFRGLDEPSKAKSTNYALVVMEEAEEFSLEDFRRLNERVRQTGSWPLRIIIVLNPVDEDHWIYKEFVENAEAWEKSGGLELIRFSTHDNLENLPPGYIDQITTGMSPQEILRFVHGHWGTIVKGKAVYADILNPLIHLRKVDMFPGATLLRGWDFGFNHPACSIRLVDLHGRMNIKHVMMGEKVYLDEFVPQVIAQTNSLFKGHGQIFDFGDPRGHDKKDKKGTPFDILADFGINAVGERGSREYVEEGIKQVRREFSTLIGGVPQLTMDPKVSLLRTAYFGRYVRDDDGSPKKDGYYDHACDADRYISHHHRHSNAVLQAMARKKQRLPINTITGYGYGKATS